MLKRRQVAKRLRCEQMVRPVELHVPARSAQHRIELNDAGICGEVNIERHAVNDEHRHRRGCRAAIRNEDRSLGGAR